MSMVSGILEFAGCKIIDNTTDPNELLAGAVCLTLANMIREREADIDGAAAEVDTEWGMLAEVMVKITERGAIRNEPYPGAAKDILGLE